MGTMSEKLWAVLKMGKCLRIALTIWLIASPCPAMTSNSDMVGVLNMGENESDPIRVYKKKWSDLTMDAATRNKIIEINKKSIHSGVENSKLELRT